MANDAKKAQARRRLEKSGGKNLPAITVSDFEAWTAILRDRHFIHEEQEPDVEQVRKASEAWIKDQCREYRREQADALIHARTGILERLEGAEPPPLESALCFQPSGSHWSFRSGVKRDKGRSLSKEEAAKYIPEEPKRGSTRFGLDYFDREVLEDWEGELAEAEAKVSEAEAMGSEGMSIIGSAR
jgi:hypothetical protein